jgi:hypothetical protein
MHYSENIKLAKRLVEVIETMAKLDLEREELVSELAFDDALAQKAVSDKVDEAFATRDPIVLEETVELKPTQAPTEAMEVYEAALPKITEAQGRMIFALLTNNHAIVPDEDKKAVIRGIVKEEHGVEIKSTKELSKVWAGDVITYIQKAKTEDLKKFWENEQAF